MNMSVDDCDFNIIYCYINVSLWSESQNHNYNGYTTKRDENYTNRYSIEKKWFPYGESIGVMLPVSALNQYINMEYNNYHKIKQLISFKIWLHLLLHQQMTKDVHYLAQYTRKPSYHIYLKCN